MTDEAALQTGGPLRTLVVEGPLALRTERLAAARRGDIGLQILTLPLLAARLAGGFTRPAASADLAPAIESALEAAPLADLAGLATLPGMRAALSRTLERLWRADLDLAAAACRHPRLAALHAIDAHVRGGLPAGALAPPDLAAAALARIALAPRLLGEVRLQNIRFISPVWRPLLAALGVPGDVGISSQDQAASAPEVFLCASPEQEALEALRWARSLITVHGVAPSQIAIASVSPRAWDAALLGAAGAADFPLHFTQGAPALATPDGQACAALAELLVRGLSLDRVRRWLAYAGGRAPMLAALPAAPLVGIPSGAALPTLDHWRRALAAAAEARNDEAQPAQVLLPALELMAQGISGAKAAGAALLTRSATRLWDKALRVAPAAALPYVLETLRVADGRDPGACVTWGPAAHLAAAPRPHVWLLGLNAGAWPRDNLDDPLLPNHILSLSPDQSPGRAEEDRRAFRAIAAGASGGLRLSFTGRARSGAARAPSALIPRAATPRRLSRLRRPRHALSEGDRLQARPEEARLDPRLGRALAGHQAWQAQAATAHDGLVRAGHPLIQEVLQAPQSARSLSRLLRDPQRFLWEYVLSWQAPEFGDQPLSLDDRVFGILIHELLQRTVDRLEPDPGFTRAGPEAVEDALADAVAQTRRTWPLRRPTPPDLLWTHTLEAAAALALRALRFDQSFQPGTRSFTEAAFGEPEARPERSAWPAGEAPVLPGTEVRLRGWIDRLDLTADDLAARVTDYKTGRAPPQAGGPLRGGAELQRVVYAAAARHHRPDARVVSRLIHLISDPPQEHRLAGEDLDRAFVAAARCVLAGQDLLLRRGVALPGPDAYEAYNAFRLAMPADVQTYRARKGAAFDQAFGAFRLVWSER